MPNDDARNDPASGDHTPPAGQRPSRRLPGDISPQDRPAYTSRKRNPAPADSSGGRAPRRARDRYQLYRQPRRQGARRSRPGTTTTADPATPLRRAFDHAEQEQLAAQRSPRNRLRRMTRNKWFLPAVGIPSVIVLALMIVMAPVLYSAFNAYRDVQVDDVQHIQSAFVPQLNVQGTPELVAAPTEQSSIDWNGKDRITILLLGVDMAESGAARTDTLILVNIDPQTKSASMLSIPRDLKVVIPGYGIDKINAAFALGDFNKVQGGGAGLTIRTIEANLGIPISGFVQIDFNGFIEMVDTVGGITVDVPYPIKDDTYPAENYRYQRIYFPAGWQHMDGEEALVYARTRHQDGDARRSARQQQVLLGLRQQALGLDLIPQLPKLIEQFGDSVRTDISITDAVQLARLGTDIPRENISQVSLLPVLWDEQVPGGPYYLNADWTMLGDVLSEFTGSDINPPGAAISNPDYSVPILIENGTTNKGLAGRVGDILEANGFWNVEVANAEEGSDIETTTIRDRDNNLGTSALITNLIGIGADTITLGESEDATIGDGTGRSAAPSRNDYAIVITLGTDAPDPAGDQWNLQDYQREAGNDGAFEDPSDADATEPDEIPDQWEDEDNEGF